LTRWVRLARDQATTAGTLAEKEQDLRALFADTARLAGSARGFLEVNGATLVRAGEVSAPTLALLQRYSPEFPCVLQGMVGWTPRAAQSYRDHVFHITMETVPRQPTGYSRRDDPEFGAANGLHGRPTCATLPSPPYSQADPAPLPWWANRREGDDGIAGSHGKYRAAPGFRPAPRSAR
jgi:phospholipid/cholesterol/gamma-HCH transport system substrate-binding protein